MTHKLKGSSKGIRLGYLNLLLTLPIQPPMGTVGRLKLLPAFISRAASFISNAETHESHIVLVACPPAHNDDLELYKRRILRDRIGGI